MNSFYSRLSYSLGNEDWATEQKALQIRPNSTILCITASGDRPLNLLLNECSHLLTIDANPIQTALFDLKKTALAHFSYEDYIAFLGLQPMSNRWQRCEELLPALLPSSHNIWKKHHKKIRKGILFQGTIEQLCTTVSYIIRFFRAKKIRQLFSFDEVSHQAEFVDKHFDTPSWRRCIYLALHPKILSPLLRDPGLSDYVDEQIHVGHHIHQCINSGLKTFPAKESSLLSLLFQRKIDLNHLPPYLSREGASQIQKQLNRVACETKDLLTYLREAPSNSFDRFSFSDVASYLPYSMFEQVLHEMVRVAKPGARFCLRQFLSNYQTPPSLRHRIIRNTDLESS